MRSRAILAAALALAAARTAAAGGLEAFPRADEVFPKLLASPKQVQLGVSRYAFLGRGYADLSLGHAWGLLRGRAGDQLWLWQWDARAMSFSRWSGSSLEAADLVGELPVSVRRGDVSGVASLFHENSHLGDDRIRRTGRAAVRTTATGLRVLAAIEPWPWLRGYGGASFLFDSAPSPKRWGLQSGLEASTDDLKWFADFPASLYAAEDLQFPERVGFNPSSHAVVGLKIGYKGSRRAVRAQAGYYSGHSYYGQFFADREHFADLSLIFEL